MIGHPDIASPSPRGAEWPRTDREIATPNRDPLMLLAEAGADPEDIWDAVARAACTATHASVAGVMLGSTPQRRGLAGDRDQPTYVQLEALGRMVTAEPRGVCWSDPAGTSHLIAVAIGRPEDPEHGFVWAGRDLDDFDWREAINLRALAATGTLLHVLESRVVESDLRARESEHRCGNDLQLIQSLLAFQSRQTHDDAGRNALQSAASRVETLTLARRVREPELSVKLRRLCDALDQQVEDRGIIVSVAMGNDIDGLTPRRVDYLLIAVNELVTNAIKHGFAAGHGRIAITAFREQDTVVVTVDDDGIPLPPVEMMTESGSGLSLVTRLVALTRGTLTLPVEGKAFRIEMPLVEAAHRQGAVS